METISKDDKYVFFLKLNETLPEFYYELANLFKEIEFTLIPVEPESLKEFSYIEKKFVIVVRHDLESQVNYFNKKNAYLNYLLKHSKVMVLDFSSFGEIPLVKKFRLQTCYRYYPLPMEFDEIVIRMAYLYYKESSAKHVWPGGRRGKFPAMPG